MKKDILISTGGGTASAGAEGEHTIRVATVADGELYDYSITRPGGNGNVGNIYKGAVTNVFSGTQSCFVNIGTEKNAVMYADDVAPAFADSTVRRPIETMIRAGQAVVVQVLREASGDKGARVTTRLALPGKYLVLLPNVRQCTVSRRITDQREASRLRGLAFRLAATAVPEGCGLIVRTEAAGAAEALLAADAEALSLRFADMSRNREGDQIPVCIHREADLCREILFRAQEDDVARVIVDGRDIYRELISRAATHNPDVSYKISHYREPWALFAFYGVQTEIKNLTARRVWLKSGAYIVIDRTEAMTVIDVNTGKYNGAGSRRETVLRVNTEALVEAARQIRFRDIGGIVVVDAIRMNDVADQRAVQAAFEAELAKDRQKTVVAGFTRLGLLEMTRKKTKPDEPQTDNGGDTSGEWIWSDVTV